MTNTMDAIAPQTYDITENYGSPPVVTLTEEELSQYCTQKNLNFEIMKDMALGNTRRNNFRGYTCVLHEETTNA